ncbi:MAG: DNA repair protein RadC [Bacteroidales bacterium]|nr:DNA repair protein RadC [Bacteroidales bacterium]
MTGIRTLREEERPREKMALKGAESLTITELLAIIIRTGDRGKSAIDLARELLDRSDNRLSELSKMSHEKFMTIGGMGSAKTFSILAAFEIGKRLCSEVPSDQLQIRTSNMAAQIISPFIKNLSHEECWVLYLNRANKLIGKEKISKGGVSATIMDIKIIVKKAVEKLASSIILVHNHPSGNPYPSEQDRAQTTALKEAAAYFDITLLDHIIVAENKFFSFSDENY